MGTVRQEEVPPLLQHLANLNPNTTNSERRQLLPTSSPAASEIVPPSNPQIDEGETCEGDTSEPVKYWKLPAAFGSDDLVTIHVCDENQQINRDFCCKRDILVMHMKYFEKFLSQNDNGYDDIDISVQCYAEIFEWLMTYIHDPDTDVEIEKSIVVSILISSEFLQIESLVEKCVQQVSRHINEIIKLPIDLSCISEKLINRIAYATSPKV